MIRIIQEIDLSLFRKIVFEEEGISMDAALRSKMEESFLFLREAAQKSVVYGINTGFGSMAQFCVDDDARISLQYNLIRSHSTGAGEPLSDRYVRALILARIGTFIQGKSGVDPHLVEVMAAFLNRGIYPLIPEHGGVGASGDLVQLAHLSLALIGEGEVCYKGERRPAAQVLQEAGVAPFKITLREGLALCNGTSAMTGIGLINLLYARQLFDWSVLSSVMMNEIADSYTDFMSESLNGTKRHKGQQVVAEMMRRAMQGSGRGREERNELFGGNGEGQYQHKVQPYYSLRCVPQILGPVYDQLENSEKVLLDELNSACDNPIVDAGTKKILHGGNFHGDYVALEMDKLKIAVTKMTMLAERALNYLFNDRINGMLPPYVNMGVLGLNYGMQACQFTATSATAECQTLSNPMCIHSIPCNNDNQDVVSMGTNAALMTKRVIDNSFQVAAIHLIAIVQAVDCLTMAEKLSSVTKRVYSAVRSLVPPFVEDTPKYREIAAVEHYLRDFKNFDNIGL